MKMKSAPSRLVSFKIFAVLVVLLPGLPLRAQLLSLQQVVTPSTVIETDGRPLTFAIHGFIEFKSLAELFPYIESQRQRWKGKISEAEEQRLSRNLLREGIESRVISMQDQRPLETLVTHTSDELRQAISQVREPLPAGYAQAFLAVQATWKHSLNCWSAAPVIAGRVLSNWYPIEEGIPLYGATYDSTEHFWQAVKFHPDVTVGEVKALTELFASRNWDSWLKRLDDDPQMYLANAYAVEFLRHNLTTDRMRWFREQLDTHGLIPSDKARAVQQRGSTPFRFSAYEEKIIWGDLADVLQLVALFSQVNDPIRERLAEEHFDGIYLDGRNMGFISQEFRSQMLEIWKVKYLHMPRFREVIAGIPTEIRLEHFLNDGDSPDIPIPIYVDYLNQIRQMALAFKPKETER
ncbi:MAG TPA: hypothetical protein VEJ47_06055 [Candidatus Eremiobacteraceae bacterium]|nr:hypothetical protein [Candidatus Eremiobacteraceae bacterium]